MTASSSSSAGRPTKRSNESGAGPEREDGRRHSEQRDVGEDGVVREPEQRRREQHERGAAAGVKNPAISASPPLFRSHRRRRPTAPGRRGRPTWIVLLDDEQRPAGVRELLYEPEVHERDSHSDSENRRDIPA